MNEVNGMPAHDRIGHLKDRIKISAGSPDGKGRWRVSAVLDTTVVHADTLDPFSHYFRLGFASDLVKQITGTAPHEGPKWVSDRILLAAQDREAGLAEPIEKPEIIKPVSCRQFVIDNPRLNKPVIAGMAREGETLNLISASKIGKSWQLADLLLCGCTGLEWLGAFACEPGPVLLIDNELHPGTLAYRLHTVAQAKGIRPDEYQDKFDILSLRGRNVSLFDLGDLLADVEPGKYKIIGADAWYRFQPKGFNENDNSQTMQLYNYLDELAGRLQCVWINIHHSSKGSQSDKRVTDVGSGAGAQSRAADAHIVLREHEEPGCVVLEAALRSFPPIPPLPLRWSFPLWQPADDLNPNNLKGKQTAGEQRQSERDMEGLGVLSKALTQGPATIRVLMGRAGLGRGRVERLLDQLEHEEAVKWTETTVRGNVCRVYEIIKQEAHENEGF